MGVYRPRAVTIDAEREHSATADHIFAPGDNEGRFSGIYDQNGTPLYRYPDPVGFRLKKDK